MRKVEITIIYPMDPLCSKVGGPETFIKGFIKYATEYFDIDFIKAIERKIIRKEEKRDKKISIAKEYSWDEIFIKIRNLILSNENKDSLIL